jgi:hypothetical protein
MASDADVNKGGAKGRGRTLWWEVHAAQEVMEAPVGAQGIDGWLDLKHV